MDMKSIVASLMMMMGVATLASAQVAEKKSLTISGARTAIAAAVSEAKKRARVALPAVFFTRFKAVSPLKPADR